MSLKGGKIVQSGHMEPLPANWLSEVRTAQGWVEAHPVLLSIMAILLPSISIYHYTTAENLPLSIASPDIISSLPSVLAAIAFLAVTLVVLILTPALLILEGVQRDDKGRLRVMSRDPQQRKQDLRRWFIAYCIPGALIAAAVATRALWLRDAQWLVFAAILFAFVLFTVMVRRIKKKPLGSLVSDGTILTLAFSLIQMLLAISAMQIAIKLVGDAASERLVIAAVLLAMLTLPAIQLVSVIAIEVTSDRYGFVLQAFLGALGVIFALCVVPPTGAYLAGQVIGGSASGHANCVYLKFRESENNYEELVDKKSKQTVQVKIYANASSSYLIRKVGDKDGAVYRIPQESIVSISPCPNLKKN
ncbi:hypothetical protein SAMN05428989_0004 [Pseudoxanthomonas sp. GM95]|uniref:hypothetical protein n=1 Tax=Pseudoxanthomonas sp. GM95 TaxID=1881043 RepID=UPI0008C6564B|nr:hypothetical protein [Pseudoxanthomonas sp. GM95]SEK37814.1 hypothetical protein SAMN05428989_0004 [Pseudoxanthomonas sp. GM95]